MALRLPDLESSDPVTDLDVEMINIDHKENLGPSAEKKGRGRRGGAGNTTSKAKGGARGGKRAAKAAERDVTPQGSRDSEEGSSTGGRRARRMQQESSPLRAPPLKRRLSFDEDDVLHVDGRRGRLKRVK